MNSFSPFDPLDPKVIPSATEAALHALKRQINNILSSYVGWYDPFCELIQNALDAVEQRLLDTPKDRQYEPTIRILINIKENSLTVSDNGVGLTQDQFTRFLAPNFSFKSGRTRGHKGVGATYLAYGFNYLQISTRSEDFNAIGVLKNARKWLEDPSPSGNPKVLPDDGPLGDPESKNVDRGTSVTVKFDDSTHPRSLEWIKACTAESWLKILSIRTGLGAITPESRVKVYVAVMDINGKLTEISRTGIAYYWLHNDCSKKATFSEIIDTEKKLFEKNGANFKHPDKISNLDIIYQHWNANELEKLITLDEDEKEIITRHTPTIDVEYGYTARLWQKFNEDLGVRSNYRVLSSGIQLAANNMPQGETILIPLQRNIGRQNQLHFLIHFDKYSPDLGRKGFHRELSDFSKSVSRKIAESVLAKVRMRLRANTGVAPDLIREKAITDWKQEMLDHENKRPLTIENSNFFLPTNKVSLTSIPTREQDVIALFNQLLAGGVIRSIHIMSTNEKFTYDGLFKITFNGPISNYVFDVNKNPLGVTEDTAEELVGKKFVSAPKVIEYKYSLDGLVEDFDGGDKNPKDIDLAVVWDVGDSYKERFGVTSLLIPENIEQRSYHGLTHILIDMESSARVMDIIVLKELISYLNDRDVCISEQRKKYDRA